MSKQQQRKSFNSFEELAKSFLPMPELPELPRLDLTKLELAREKAKEIEEKAPEIEAWVEYTFHLLKEVEQLPEAAQHLLAKEVEEQKSRLNYFLDQVEVPTWRKAAWMGLYKYHLTGQELTSREEVEELFAQLVKKGYLQETKNGLFLVHQKGYGPSLQSQFGPNEIKKMRGWVTELLHMVGQFERELAKVEREEIVLKGNLTLSDFLGGKPGTLVLDVPPEKGEENGQVFWRPGGTLLLESDGSKVFPVAATGKIKEAVIQVKESGVHLLLSSLENENPPKLRNLLGEERDKMIRRLWSLLKRGIRAIKEKEQRQALRKSFQSRAEIFAEEFFLQEKPGTCYVEFAGSWEVKSPNGVTTDRIPDLFFLVSRVQEGESWKIRLVDVPPHLREFFAPCLEQEFAITGERFHGVAHPLRAVLMAIYRQIRAASYNDVKDEPELL